MKKIDELRERRAAISEQLQEILKGDMTPEKRAEYDAKSKEADELAADITRCEKADKLAAEMSQRAGRPPMGQPGSGHEMNEEQEARERKTFERRQNAAFGHFLRTGNIVGDFLKRDSEVMQELPKELRDLGLASATSSLAPAVFVPADFEKKIEEALLAYGDLIPAVTAIPTSTGAPMPFPTSNDTAETAEILGEGIGAGTGDPTISSVIMGAFKYSTKLVPVSIELAQDSAFPIDSWLSKLFGLRLARKLTSDITNGAGTTMPYGIVTQATLGRTAVGSSANTGGSENGTNTIGTADLNALIHSVDPSYRPGAKFVMHDTTVEALEGLLDKYGRPLFLPNPQTGRLTSLFGYPIVVDQYMEELTVDSPITARKTVLFGDLSKYVLRKVKELSVLRLVERYAEKGQIGFIGFARYDGNLIDAGTHPVKYLKQATS